MAGDARTPGLPRVLLVILDGLADRPWPELDGLTPLEAARTPNLDGLASSAATGLMHPLGRGRAPGSDLAHFVLFGYPEALYPGRSVFEAAGDGVELSTDEVAFRALFCTTERREDGSLVLARHFAAVSDEVCRELAEEIAAFEHGGLSLRLTFTRDRQGILTVRGSGAASGGAASQHVTDCDPFFPGRPVAAVRPLTGAPDPDAALRTAEAVTAYLRHAYRALSAHPLSRGAPPERRADFVLVKWTGRRRPLPRFESLTGMRGASVSTGTLFRGLAAGLGLAHREPPYLPDPAEDLTGRIAEAARAFEDGADFVHVHTKAPDEAGHRKDPRGKRDVIARLDEALAALLPAARDRAPMPGAPALPRDTLVVVTADHGTPAGTGLIHSGDPVPLLLLGPCVRPDGVTLFGEGACAEGVLGQFEGRDLMPMLLNLRGTTRYLGARLHPDAGPAWPGTYEPFTVE
ncbi:MAG: 2,3-bisphosphoglycerate-independent phosphoglycerate mutase [Coriobacteriia bacterium]|nr:2,3-bisphosphoglycerate-independent phosphoglycerate mutase [Coriobacteriia bacterium]